MRTVVKGGVDGSWGEIVNRFGKEPEDPWLERWQVVIEISRYTPILELGCGGGQDARFLTGLGFVIIATDFSLKERWNSRGGARLRPRSRTLTSPAAFLSPTPLFG